MCNEILLNPTVLATIGGALIGAISSWILAIATEQYKARKRKKGAKALIQSEIFYIINVLERFRDKYLKEKINIDDKEKREEVFNFYGMMSNFPIWTNRNWINLIEYIPDIFNKNEINDINNFYAKCEEATDNANALAEIEPYDAISFYNGNERKIPMDLSTINSDRNRFKSDLDELIELGKHIKKIFE